MHETMQAFRGAILAALGHAPEVIEPGRLHRFATSERRADDAGWCKLGCRHAGWNHRRSRPAGPFGAG